MGELRMEPMPVQREIWTLLGALRDPVLDPRPLFDFTVVEVPRRAGKTEALLSLAVGRCASLPGYQVTYCAQSGTKSRERFYGLLRLLRAHGVAGCKARESRGEERIEWVNGSMLRFLPPLASTLRGDAVDWLILDEAQEVGDEAAVDLLGSSLPVFDTRPQAQLTVAGTAGEQRSGLLWTALERGRAGHWGIVEYAAPDGFDEADESRWLDVHPGPAGVSPERALEVLRSRHAEMEPAMFAREYLGIWPTGVSGAAFSEEMWEACGAPQPPQPTRYGLAYDVVPDGSRAAVTATWRDEDGYLWGQVLAERQGFDWVPAFVAAIALRDRVPVAYDPVGANLSVADVLNLRHRTVTHLAVTLKEVTAACSSLDAAVRLGTFRHARQQPLTEAVAAAVRRDVGDAGWAWGRRRSSASIAPLVGVTVGLRAFDALPPVRRLQVLTAR